MDYPDFYHRIPDVAEDTIIAHQEIMLLALLTITLYTLFHYLSSCFYKKHLWVEKTDFPKKIIFFAEILFRPPSLVGERTKQVPHTTE